MTVSTLAASGRLGELVLARIDGDDQQLELLLDPEAEPPSPLRHPPLAYTWPTWTPDGSALLLSTLEGAGSAESPAQVLRYNVNEQRLQVLYLNPQSSGLVGPGLPHYLNPSTDGQHLVVLAQTIARALTLVYVDALGRGPAQAIARGAPLFSAWSPASDALAVHAGGELSLMELESAPSMQSLASNHVGYRVPAWSPDGQRIAVSAQEGPRTSLLLVDRRGRTQVSLAPSWPTAVLAWSPAGDVIAHAQMSASEPPRYGGLQLVDASGGGVRPLFAGAIRAFCWSPDGQRLGILLPHTRPDLCAWLIVDRDGKTISRSAPFQPSPEFAVLITFFDQYLLSHRLWSADGSMLLGAGRMQHNGTPLEHAGWSVYVFRAEDGSARSVAAGSIASWSPIADSGS